MQINNSTFPLAIALRQVGKRIRLRGWERLLRTLFHPDKQDHIAFQIPFNNFIYPAYADSFIDWNVLFYSSYETFELTLFAKLASHIEGAIFLDVGANVGHHALFMAPHADQIHAFEPNPSLWPLIDEKIFINKIQNISLHKCGLGSTEGNLPLYLGPESGESSLLLPIKHRLNSGSVKVMIIRGDDMFVDAGISKIDLVKIDIEGFEKYAIQGMIQHLDRWRPIMMVELSEIGKELFGDFSNFVKSFPSNYEFHFCCRTLGLVIHRTLIPANEFAYESFSGNVFCVPFEKKKHFLDMANIS